MPTVEIILHKRRITRFKVDVRFEATFERAKSIESDLKNPSSQNKEDPSKRDTRQ